MVSFKKIVCLAALISSSVTMSFATTPQDWTPQDLWDKGLEWISTYLIAKALCSNQLPTTLPGQVDKAYCIAAVQNSIPLLEQLAYHSYNTKWLSQPSPSAVWKIVNWATMKGVDSVINFFAGHGIASYEMIRAAADYWYNRKNF